MAHSREVKEKALQVYLQCRTVEGVSKICDVPYSTIRKWKLKHGWDKKLEEYKEDIADNPFEENKELQKYIEGFDIPKEDADLLNDIKTVEGVCFGCMRGSIPEDNIALRPRNFKECMDALKMCWQTREALLHRDKKSSVTVNGPAKFDFVTIPGK